MGRKSETVLFLVCINIFGLTRTIGEYKHKKNLRWFLLFGFGFIFVIVGGISIVELLRASDILIQIEELKEHIKDMDDNITEAKNEKQAVIDLMVQTKINMLHVSCMRRGYAFRREGLICIKRIFKEDTYYESLKSCEHSESVSLLLIDTTEKIKMMQNEFPFDNVVNLNFGDDAIYWVAGARVNGQYKYPNGSNIHRDSTYYIDGETVENGCLAVSKKSGYKFTAYPCDSKFLSICEITITYVKDDFEKDL